MIFDIKQLYNHIESIWKKEYNFNRPGKLRITFFNLDLKRLQIDMEITLDVYPKLREIFK